MKKTLQEISEWRAKNPMGILTLEYAALEGAELCGFNLRAAILPYANLHKAILHRADLRRARLDHANLRCADLFRADLTDADLRYADLSGARLCNCDLSKASLEGADLSNTQLDNSNLDETNLSGVKGLTSAAEFIHNLEKCAEGVIAYKTFNNHYQSPSYWKIQRGSVLTETVNPNRTVSYGCGINLVNTAEAAYKKSTHKREVWRVLVKWIDLADAVIPFNSTWQFRVGRCTLLEPVSSCYDIQLSNY